jgi:hypothetical protein
MLELEVRAGRGHDRPADFEALEGQCRAAAQCEAAGSPPERARDAGLDAGLDMRNLPRLDRQVHVVVRVVGQRQQIHAGRPGYNRRHKRQHVLANEAAECRRTDPLPEPETAVGGLHGPIQTRHTKQKGP